MGFDQFQPSWGFHNLRLLVPSVHCYRVHNLPTPKRKSVAGEGCQSTGVILFPDIHTGRKAAPFEERILSVERSFADTTLSSISGPVEKFF